MITITNTDFLHQVFCTCGVGKMNSTMSEEPDALSVVNQLRDLAADPLNRRAIVQDQGCLPGLILFLDHPNPPVVHSALLVSILEIKFMSFGCFATSLLCL